jgi:hypothetical protein
MKFAAKAVAKVFGKSLANGQGWPEYAVEYPIDLAWDRTSNGWSISRVSSPASKFWTTS